MTASETLDSDETTEIEKTKRTCVYSPELDRPNYSHDKSIVSEIIWQLSLGYIQWNIEIESGKHITFQNNWSTKK